MPLLMSLEGPAVAPADKIKAGLYAVTPKGVLRAGFQFTEGLGNAVSAWPTWMKWLVGGTAVLGVVGVGCAVYNYRRTSGNLRGGRLGAASASARKSAIAIAEFDEGHIQPGIEARNEFPRKSDAEIIELVQSDIEDYRDTWKDQHGDDVEASGTDLDEAFDVYKTRYVNLTRERLRRTPRRARELEGPREDKTNRHGLTWDDWADMANVKLSHLSERDGRDAYNAWRTGRSPSEFAPKRSWGGEDTGPHLEGAGSTKAEKALEKLRQHTEKFAYLRETRPGYEVGFGYKKVPDVYLELARQGRVKIIDHGYERKVILVGGGLKGARGAKTNEYGMTLNEWLHSAFGRNPPNERGEALPAHRKAWAAGEDPSDYRARKASPLEGKAPADCHTLANQIWKATNAAANAMDRPNLTNSEAQALHNKHRARAEKLEKQFRAQGC